MHTLTELFSQYELLEITAEYISAVDLFHTALTCRDLYQLIRSSDSTFTRLRDTTLCDGSGLRARQEFKGRYNGLRYGGSANWRRPKSIQKLLRCRAYEENEVRVWSVKCDAANTRPCLKCRIPICKECRCVPRYRNYDGYDPSRRPHLNDTYQSDNVIVYCEQCDPAVEESTDHSLCDCDRYERWICLKCADEEEEEERAYQDYCRKMTKEKHDDGWYNEDLSKTGMELVDHQSERYVSIRGIAGQPGSVNANHDFRSGVPAA